MRIAAKWLRYILEFFCPLCRATLQSGAHVAQARANA
ncbi:MAG: hypothetical protein ACR2H5_02585 [Ktedonobacteraceae bacterium]